MNCASIGLGVALIGLSGLYLGFRVGCGWANSELRSLTNGFSSLNSDLLDDLEKSHRAEHDMAAWRAIDSNLLQTAYANLDRQQVYIEQLLTDIGYYEVEREGFIRQHGIAETVPDSFDGDDSDDYFDWSEAERN